MYIIFKNLLKSLFCCRKCNCTFPFSSVQVFGLKQPPSKKTMCHLFRTDNYLDLIFPLARIQSCIWAAISLTFFTTDTTFSQHSHILSGTELQHLHWNLSREQRLSQRSCHFISSVSPYSMITHFTVLDILRKDPNSKLWFTTHSAPATPKLLLLIYFSNFASSERANNMFYNTVFSFTFHLNLYIWTIYSCMSTTSECHIFPI